MPELKIEVTLTDSHGRNAPVVRAVDSLSPREIARMIGDYAHAIYAMPREVYATVRCVHAP